jgi:hypothetical protein
MEEQWGGIAIGGSKEQGHGGATRKINHVRGVPRKEPHGGTISEEQPPERIAKWSSKASGEPHKGAASKEHQPKITSKE